VKAFANGSEQKGSLKIAAWRRSTEVRILPKSLYPMCIFVHIVLDKYSRELRGLRLSVTARCNLSCFYCHGEGQAGEEGELSLREIELLAENFKKIGIDNLKLTGGEPLLRDDIASIASAFTKRGIETGITTNGTLLLEKANALAKSGVKRVNVNLPSVDEEIYERITGKPFCSKVKEGCKAAKANGLEVKLNMVLLRQMNDTKEDLMKMLDFARSKGFNLQLIELESCSAMNDGVYEKYHVGLDALEKEIASLAKGLRRKALHNTKIYQVDGINVEIVAPMGNPDFCLHCTRLRITANGKIKPCLFLPAEQSVREVLEDFERFKALIEEVWLNRKPYFR